jgi:hypothetical protein
VSRSAAQSGGSAAGVKAVGAMVFVVVMALVVLLMVRARPGPDPFDPRSGQPSGARGLVVTLQAAGADVTDTRDVPVPFDETRVLVLEDRLNDRQRQDLLDFVESGGIAIVADPDSSLHGGSGIDGGAIQVAGYSNDVQESAEVDRNVLPGRCSVDALSDLRGVLVPDGVLFPVGPDEPQCFTDLDVGEVEGGGHSFVIVREIGDGLIVGLGDNEPFINEFLRRGDNSGLMVSLLVPDRNADVTFLLGSDANPTVSDVGSGDETLRDLIPPWVWMSLVLGAISFVVFAVSRSARVGRLVAEPIAAPIAGSELVSATGNLMERAGHAERAAWLLRDRLHRDLCRSHGVDFGAPLDELDRVVGLRSGSRPGEVEALLRSHATGAGGLLELTSSIDRLRLSVFGSGTTADGVPRPTAPHSGDPAHPAHPDEKVST